MVTVEIRETLVQSLIDASADTIDKLTLEREEFASAIVYAGQVISGFERSTFANNPDGEDAYNQIKRLYKRLAATLDKPKK